MKAIQRRIFRLALALFGMAASLAAFPVYVVNQIDYQDPVSLAVATVEPKATFPLDVKVLERHEHSSQTFIPLRVSRYLVLATLDAPGGGPDLSRLRAFVARAGQGVTYAMGTWHHPLTVLDGPAAFAVLMWRDGSPGDEEFVPVTTPLTIDLPQEA